MAGVSRASWQRVRQDRTRGLSRPPTSTDSPARYPVSPCFMLLSDPVEEWGKEGIFNIDIQTAIDATEEAL